MWYNESGGIVKKLFIFLSLFLLLGCTNKIEERTCKINVENGIEGYTLKGEYKIYFDKYEYVTKVEKEEMYESNDEEVLEYFNRSKEIDYKNISKYGGYEYTVEKLDDKVHINVIIDLKQTDVKQMIIDKKIDRDYTDKNKITLYGIKDYYESKGAICDIE